MSLSKKGDITMTDSRGTRAQCREYFEKVVKLQRETADALKAVLLVEKPILDDPNYEPTAEMGFDMGGPDDLLKDSAIFSDMVNLTFRHEAMKLFRDFNITEALALLRAKARVEPCDDSSPWSVACTMLVNFLDALPRTIQEVAYIAESVSTDEEIKNYRKNIILAEVTIGLKLLSGGRFPLEHVEAELVKISKHIS